VSDEEQRPATSAGAFEDALANAVAQTGIDDGSACGHVPGRRGPGR